MLYLITQFDINDLDAKEIQGHASQLNDKLMQEGCKLLMHSDQMEFSIYNMEERLEGDIRKLCDGFKKYSEEIVHTDFEFDLFTWEDIEDSGHFEPEFIEAIKRAEGRSSELG